MKKKAGKRGRRERKRERGKKQKEGANIVSNFDGLDTRVTYLEMEEEIGIGRHSLDNDRELPINRSARLRFTPLYHLDPIF